MFTSIKAKLSHIKVKLHEQISTLSLFFLFWTCLYPGLPFSRKKPGAIRIYYYYFKILTLIMISRGSSNILVS